MTTYLVFETQDQADAAQIVIANNMGLGNDTTKAWAIPRQAVDNRWAFTKPDDMYMMGVLNYSEVDDPDFPANLN